MKIVEALKKIKINKKKMAANRVSITRYSSGVSTEKPIFATEKEQIEQVNSYYQANEDLYRENLRLKRLIDKTNLAVTVDFGGQAYCLTDLLQIKREYGKEMLETCQAMNDNSGDMRLRNSAGWKDAGGQSPRIVRFYDEKAKNQKHREWMELVDSIDMRLEVINATTDIVE